MPTGAREGAVSPVPLVLGFLMSGPAHPYELYQEFSRRLGRVWRLGQSHMYAYLNGIEAEGLATAELEEQQGRPARKVYRITAAGKKRFREWMRAPSRQVRNIRLEFLAKLYFYRALGLEGAVELVRDQKAVLAERIAAMEALMLEEGDEYWRLVLDFRRSEAEAIALWLDRCALEQRDPE
jgi:PadR family transcriptional regulator, regulatory protein AphA